LPGSIRSGRVIEVLSKLISVHGSPKYLRSDNGPEFVSRAVLKWLTEANIDTAHIDPGKPWQNGCNESFNGKFRDECLSMEWFRNRIDAKIVIEQFRRHYNEVRPHSSLGQLTPAEFKQQLSSTNHPELDRLGKNRTNWNVSFATKSGLEGRRFCREEEAVFSRADHGDFEAGRPGYADPGAVSGAWDLRAELLPLEEDIRWYGTL
jgi:hypothetical protein